MDYCGQLSWWLSGHLSSCKIQKQNHIFPLLTLTLFFLHQVVTAFLCEIILVVEWFLSWPDSKKQEKLHELHWRLRSSRSLILGGGPPDTAFMMPFRTDSFDCYKYHWWFLNTRGVAVHTDGLWVLFLLLLPVAKHLFLIVMWGWVYIWYLYGLFGACPLIAI